MKIWGIPEVFKPGRSIKGGPVGLILGVLQAAFSGSCVGSAGEYYVVPTGPNASTTILGDTSGGGGGTGVGSGSTGGGGSGGGGGSIGGTGSPPQSDFIKLRNTAGTVEVHWDVLSGGSYKRAGDYTSDFSPADANNGSWQADPYP
jgi:hypothetical protein